MVFSCFYLVVAADVVVFKNIAVGCARASDRLLSPAQANLRESRQAQALEDVLRL